MISSTQVMKDLIFRLTLDSHYITVKHSPHEDLTYRTNPALCFQSLPSMFECLHGQCVRRSQSSTDMLKSASKTLHVSIFLCSAVDWDSVCSVCHFSLIQLFYPSLHLVCECWLGIFNTGFFHRFYLTNAGGSF